MGQYLTHRDIPDKEGRGSDLAEITYSVLEEYDSVDTLAAVLMDNTPVNTGFSGGLCACLEKKLGRKLHLIGCFLHINELPLRHIIRDLDGPAKSGNKLSGKIGEQLDDDDLYRKDPVQFEPIPLGFERTDPEDIEDLSEDQRLLLEYMYGVGCGKVDDKFVKRKPGPLNLSRWLTTATRILILYTRTLMPSETLKVIVTFIVKCYAPTWFLVKRKNNFLLGPCVFFEMIQAVKEVEANVLTFITPRQEGEEPLTDKVFRVLSRNGFCCLGENFLASLLFSDERSHRQLAVDKILKIRSGPQMKLTPTRIPKINFEAEDWSKLVDISTIECHVPPCVAGLSNEIIESFVSDDNLWPAYPLHSQSVERAVKLTSDASKKSYIWEKRHQYIVAATKSKAERPKFRSKSDYK
jgi:hypothetical protein